MTRHLSVVPTPAHPTSIKGMVDTIAAGTEELQRILHGLKAAAEAEKLNAEFALSASVIDTSTWFITSEIRCHERRISKLTAELNAVLGDNPAADHTRARIQGRIDLAQDALDDLLAQRDDLAEAANYNDAA